MVCESHHQGSYSDVGTCTMLKSSAEFRPRGQPGKQRLGRHLSPLASWIAIAYYYWFEVCGIQRKTNGKRDRSNDASRLDLPPRYAPPKGVGGSGSGSARHEPIGIYTRRHLPPGEGRPAGSSSFPVRQGNVSSVHGEVARGAVRRSEPVSPPVDASALGSVIDKIRAPETSGPHHDLVAVGRARMGGLLAPPGSHRTGQKRRGDITSPRLSCSRRARDSNPEGLAPGGFQDRCLTN